MSDFSDPTMGWHAMPGPATTPAPIVPLPAYVPPATGPMTLPRAGGTGQVYPPSSSAPMTAGLLIAIAGAASIVFYMAYAFRSQSSFLGLFPGLRTLSYKHVGSDYYSSGLPTVFVISAVVCGLAWIAVGLFIILAVRRRLTTIAIVILVLYGLLVLVASIESYLYIQFSVHGHFTGGLIGGVIGAFVMPPAQMAAVALLIPAGNAAARGADASGLKLTAIILLSLCMAWNVGMEFIMITNAHVPGSSVAAWLLTAVALRVGLIVLAAGISGARPQPYVQAPLAMPQMTPLTMPDGSQRTMPVFPQPPQPLTPQQWRP